MLKDMGIDAAVIDPFTIKPFDEALIRAYAAKTGIVVTAENHNRIGGLYSAVKEALNGEALVGHVAVEDTFGEVGPQEYLRERFDLTAEHIVRTIKKKIERVLFGNCETVIPLSVHKSIYRRTYLRLEIDLG